MLLTIVIFLLFLSILVLIHEAGHFFVAKWFGIKVEEFGFGFPPKALSFKRGETVYSINWLPIGGFVKLYGEDEVGGGKLKIDNSKLKVKDEKRAFYARSVSQRALVVLAGVIMNAILASVIFYVFLLISNFKTELPVAGFSVPKLWLVDQQVKNDIIISSVSKNSPAQKAGMKPFTKIISVNGIFVGNTKEFVDVINQNKGKEVELVWQNVKTNQVFQASMTPRISPPKDEGSLGVGFYPFESVVLEYKTPLQKILSGPVHASNLMKYNLEIMGELIGLSFKEKNLGPVSQGVSGPVGIARVVGVIGEIPNVKERILQYLNIAGILSSSLAFFNVLPIPALDGGRLFFILIEGITRRKVNPKFEGYAHAIGMAVLLTLILLITFKDILQLFH